MLERVLILGALAALVTLCWWMWRMQQARRVQQLARQELLFAPIVPVGQPAIVAFTLPNCQDCRARQAPALVRLRSQLDAQVAIVTLNVAEHPELADRLGLLTVPATAVVDAQGMLRHLNQGFADEAVLRQQLPA